MVVVAVKKKCLKKGKEYGPYPKDPDTWYLYRVYRNGDKVVSRYLGKGPKSKGAVVQELKGKSVVRENNCRKCDGFEDELLKRELAWAPQAMKLRLDRRLERERRVQRNV